MTWEAHDRLLAVFFLRYKYVVSVSLSQNLGQQGRGDAQTHWCAHLIFMHAPMDNKLMPDLFLGIPSQTVFLAKVR